MVRRIIDRLLTDQVEIDRRDFVSPMHRHSQHETQLNRKSRPVTIASPSDDSAAFAVAILLATYTMRNGRGCQPDLLGLNKPGDPASDRDRPGLRAAKCPVLTAAKTGGFVEPGRPLPLWHMTCNDQEPVRACKTSDVPNNHNILERSTIMAGKAEEIKGRVKEAAGALADNDKLRREGKIDQAAGKVKNAAEKVVEKVKDSVKQVNRDS